MNPDIKNLSFRLVKYHRTPGASSLAIPRREFFNQIDVYIPGIEAVEDKTCTICLEPAETGFITKCHHIFHKECLLDYLDQFTRKGNVQTFVITEEINVYGNVQIVGPSAK